MLVEWRRLQIPPGTEHVIERIADAGYHPILAHPERYIGIKQDLNCAGAWRNAGAYLQVNHGSFTGRYGPEARGAASELVARGWADYLSSDFHARAHLEIHLRDAEGFFAAHDGLEQFGLLTVTNPGAGHPGPTAFAGSSVADSRGVLGSVCKDLQGVNRRRAK